MTISGNGDWLIGNENNPSDIIINNSDGKISAPNGDLTLLSSTSGNIVAESFLQINNSCQSGIVDILVGENESIDISCQGLTENAIILLTPRQDTDVKYWIEVNPNNSSFCVKCNGDALVTSTISFNYFIVKK